MKRILVVLMLLSVVVGAYAVSGKIIARFNTSGPLFSYWGGGYNGNTDLWQNKDSTGFELGFDSFGLTYKPRMSIAIPWGLELAPMAGAYDERGWGGTVEATTPGYFKIRDIKLGNLLMQVGLAWHQAFVNVNEIWTNTNGGALSTNADIGFAFSYNKFYLDYKFDLPLGDMITIKQYDWDLMHFEYSFGSSTWGGNQSLTNNIRQGSEILAYVPLQIMINANPIAITLSPLFVYWGSTLTTNNYLDSSKSNNIVDSSRMKAGGYARVNIGLADFASIYLMGGAFLTTTKDFDRDVVGTEAAYNTNVDSSSSSLAIPAFAGIVLKIGPGIKATIGWGIQYADQTSINALAGTTNRFTTMFSRYGYYDNWGQPKDEFKSFGDNFMDLAFMRFGSDAKFAGNWSVGIAGGVALNDKWTYPWLLTAQAGNMTTYGASVDSMNASQLLSFINFLNYDRQMYIKYEDENVAIKGTISQEGNKNLVSSIAGNNGPVNSGGNDVGWAVSSLFGMFETVDITIKF